MFPRFKNGRLLGIKYRTADKRMRQNSNPEPSLYNLDLASKAGGSTLVICEGELDTMVFDQCGVPAAVSVPNGAPPEGAKDLTKWTAFLDADADFLARWERFVLAVDGDGPGKRCEQALCEKLGVSKCWRVNYPAGCKDANDVLVMHGEKVVRALIHDAKLMPVAGLYSPEDVSQKVLQLYDTGLQRGRTTGWKAVDEIYSVRDAEMTVVTGMPGSGKSTWLDALTVNLWCSTGFRTAFCSPENWPIQRHIASILEKVVSKPFGGSTISSARMTREEMTAGLAKMQGSFFFTELPEMRLNAVLEVMEAAVTRNKVNGVVLDPWNEMEHHRSKDCTETEFVSETLGRIRKFARANGVHVWLVAHPTKLRRNEDGSYPVPRLYDIAGSAHFYNKADNGLAVYRRDPTKPETEIHVQKIRFREVGKLGMARLVFSRDCGVFLDMAPAKRNDAKSKAAHDEFEIDEVPF